MTHTYKPGDRVRVTAKARWFGAEPGVVVTLKRREGPDVWVVDNADDPRSNLVTEGNIEPAPAGAFKIGDRVRVVEESRFAANVGDVVTIISGPDAFGAYDIKNPHDEDSRFVEGRCIAPIIAAPVDVTPVIPVSRVAEVLARFHVTASDFDVGTVENIARSLGFEITPPQPARFTFKETI